MSDRFSAHAIRSPDDVRRAVARLREAQIRYAQFSQSQVDAVFHAVALAADRARIPLAQEAVNETGMGVMEDKVIKNHFAAEYIHNAYKSTKTCGVIEEDPSAGIRRIAEPIGVIAAVIPTTNPTSTVIFKALLALKTRNAVLFCPHPRAKDCTAAAVRLLARAAEDAGAPEGLFACVDEPSPELTGTAMREADLILATGGPGMVRAAYQSGKPAIGVGAGNTPVILDDTADIRHAVSSILHSKTFDNGLICASEQAVIVPESRYDDVKEEFRKRGAYFPTADETDRLRRLMLINGALNADIVGQSAASIAAMAGIEVPPSVKVLIGEVTDVSPAEAFAHEKLSPLLAMYKARDFDEALDMAARLVEDGGIGHTAALYLDERVASDRSARFEARMKACRILINTPSSQGAVGDLYNFRLPPSLTLGCGSWGGNSVSENVGVKHLLNIKTVAARRDNMLWLRTPPTLYFKQGCLPTALCDLHDVYHATRAFVVTDRVLFDLGYADRITQPLEALGIVCTVYTDVEPDPTLASVRRGAEVMSRFAPDAIVAIGGGSAMDAAKGMWMLYEHPETAFADVAMRFMDIRKRAAALPPMGQKARFVAVPTSSGTGSEVTPFAVITDESDGTKYPLADYELMPHMAILDIDLMMEQPPSLTAASGIDALTHAIEAYASIMHSDFTDTLALGAIERIVAYLPRCYHNGANDPEAREKLAHASTMAGMAFANAFLGLCHSMAHKLGAFHHLPHGIANALLIEEVMRFNAAEAPTKMGSFSQYTHPQALERYAAIAKALNLDGDTDEERFEQLLALIAKLKEKVGIRACVRDYGIDRAAYDASLEEMTRQAFDDQCTGANPRYPLMDEIRELYGRIYEKEAT
ncbi:MAG: bifunctional acetaldehyde-CoA/alcohol dehydrogenase [Clostridia bacterium]|nr:bifunctional acetaldehyde-CoA/alcohol dehydrogenase [Clostridia bacterium]